MPPTFRLTAATGVVGGDRRPNQLSRCTTPRHATHISSHCSNRGRGRRPPAESAFTLYHSSPCHPHFVSLQQQGSWEATAGRISFHAVPLLAMPPTFRLTAATGVVGGDRRPNQLSRCTTPRHAT